MLLPSSQADASTVACDWLWLRFLLFYIWTGRTRVWLIRICVVCKARVNFSVRNVWKWHKLLNLFSHPSVEVEPSFICAAPPGFSFLPLGLEFFLTTKSLRLEGCSWLSATADRSLAYLFRCLTVLLLMIWLCHFSEVKPHEGDCCCDIGLYKNRLTDWFTADCAASLVDESSCYHEEETVPDSRRRL